MYTVDTPFGKIVIGQSEDLFSPAHPDRGTLAMLSCVSFLPGQRVLDLGCGCGLVGLYAAMLLAFLALDRKNTLALFKNIKNMRRGA